MWYFTLALTSFLWTAENPAAICSPSQAMDLIRLLCHNVSWCGIFPRSSFGPWKDPGFQLAFFSPLTLKQPFYHLLIPKAVVFCNFPLGFPLCQHGFDLRQQRLNVCVVPFLHNKPPLM